MRTYAILLSVGLAAGTLTACTETSGTSENAGATSTASASAGGTPVASGSDASPSAPASAAAAATASRAVYWVRDTGPRTGIKLYREFHRRPATTGVVRDAVDAMLTLQPADKDYTSLWPSGTKVRGARVEGRTAYVDLTVEARSRRHGAAAEQATLQQLVHTVTAAAPSVQAVQLLLEGRRVDTLWGHVDTSRPIRRQRAAEVLGPVWVLTSSPVRRGGTIAGEASVFEANVSWEWLQGGAVVKKGFSTASIGAPGRGRWTAPVDVPPGDYVFRAYESSAEDGRPMFVDDKPIRVTAG